MSSVTRDQEKDRRRRAGLKLFGVSYDDRTVVSSRGGIFEKASGSTPKHWLMPDEDSLVGIGAVKKYGQYGPYWVFPKAQSGSDTPAPTNGNRTQNASDPIPGINYRTAYLVGDRVYTDLDLANHAALIEKNACIATVFFSEDVLGDLPEEQAPEPAPVQKKNANPQEGDACTKCGEAIDADLMCPACQWPALMG